MEAAVGSAPWRLRLRAGALTSVVDPQKRRYVVDLASELRYLSGPAFKELNNLCQMVCKQLEALLRTMEAILLQEEAEKLARRRGNQRK